MNCVFAKRRFADSGIPVICKKYYSSSAPATWYITINGIQYDWTDPINDIRVNVGDTIYFRMPANSAYIDDVQYSQEATYTVQSGVKKIVIIAYYMSAAKRFLVSTNPNHIVGYSTGSGNNTNWWCALNNDSTNYKILPNNSYPTYHYPIPLSSIAFHIRAGTNTPAIATINDTEVWRQTATGTPTTQNIAVDSGIQGFIINSSYDSTNYGGTYAIQTI